MIIGKGNMDVMQSYSHLQYIVHHIEFDRSLTSNHVINQADI